MSIENLGNVTSNIHNEFERRQFLAFMLCSRYAALALQMFRERQFDNKYWNNQTNTAYNAIFSKEFTDGDEIGWFIAHAVEYGVYLELANDRKHEALRPIIYELLPQFEKDLREIAA